MDELIGQAFMERTRYKYLDASDQQKGLPQPPLQIKADEGATLIALPDPVRIDVPPLDLRQAIENRQSVRQYAQNALSITELSYLLWCTQGVLATSGGATLRTVPSAGARHALETYLLVNRVEGLPAGLYRYLAIEHELAELSAGSAHATALAAACLGQSFVATCAAAFIFAAVPYRMTWRYGQRGYRYLLLDAGHACQNLYLAAESLGCGACAIGAFDDAAVNAALGLDGAEQLVLYLATVGRLAG